jgi:hypothetical protein
VLVIVQVLGARRREMRTWTIQAQTAEPRR